MPAIPGNPSAHGGPNRQNDALPMSTTIQLLWAAGLGLYVLALLFLSRIPYRLMVERGMEPIRAVYYNRKTVHMLAGGVGSLMVPLVFTELWHPLVAGLALTVFAFLAHSTGLRMYWFQTADNRNDVKFAVIWALSVSALWRLLGDPWLAVLPALYMAFGDGAPAGRTIYEGRKPTRSYRWFLRRSLVRKAFTGQPAATAPPRRAGRRRRSARPQARG
jgi:hypothetical protein